MASGQKSAKSLGKPSRVETVCLAQDSSLYVVGPVKPDGRPLWSHGG